jgi:hypothetical protein
MVAELTSTSGAAVKGTATTATETPDVDAKSLGLLAKDTSSGVAQTATVLAGGAMSLYARVSTDVGWVASGGSFDVSAQQTTYSQDRKTAYTDLASSTTTVAIVWTAPTTVGSYTISSYAQTVSNGENTISLSTPSGGTLSGRITVTVVAASSGGSYSPVYSVCNTSAVDVRPGTTAATANVDSAATVTNGNPWYINFRLADAYANALDNGNIVVTATNGAFVNYSEGSTATAGTGSTVVTLMQAPQVQQHLALLLFLNRQLTHQLQPQ